MHTLPLSPRALRSLASVMMKRKIELRPEDYVHPLCIALKALSLLISMVGIATARPRANRLLPSSCSWVFRTIGIHIEVDLIYEPSMRLPVAAVDLRLELLGLGSHTAEATLEVAGRQGRMQKDTRTHLSHRRSGAVTQGGHRR
jgi:hypothetical protein